MRLSHLLASACLLSSSLSVFAASFDLPRPYVLYLLDGQAVKTQSVASERLQNLSAGDHQLVIRFEGTFREQKESRLVSGEPVVINLKLQGDEKLGVKFDYPRDYRDAQMFLQTQPIQITDLKTGSEFKTDHFIMPRKEGLQIGRDYQQELVSMGKAYGMDGTAPTVSPATAAAAEAGVAAAAAQGQNQNVDPATQSLEMLKYWYSKADPKTRKAFQHWIISQD